MKRDWTDLLRDALVQLRSERARAGRQRAEAQHAHDTIDKLITSIETAVEREREAPDDHVTT